jgi:hypothetical protein
MKTILFLLYFELHIEFQALIEIKLNKKKEKEK